MISLRQAFSSSVGKKLVTAITGLALVGFIVAHLVGNLQLFGTTGEAFNAYAKKLEDLGPLTVLAELILLAFFVFHILNGIRLTLTNSRARPIGYKTLKPKPGPSMNTIGSRHMMITGIVLGIFTVIHVIQFKYGPGVAEQYVTQINGVEARDLRRLVVETFHNPWWVAFYVGCLLFLALHLRHGIWSMFQSVGAMNSRLTTSVYVLGVILGTMLAVGFILLPLWIYFDLLKVYGV